MVESNQQIDQILKLKRKNNKLVTTNAKLTQWLRRHSSKIRLKNISNRRSKHKIEQSREKLSEVNVTRFAKIDHVRAYCIMKNTNLKY